MPFNAAGFGGKGNIAFRPVHRTAQVKFGEFLQDGRLGRVVVEMFDRRKVACHRLPGLFRRRPVKHQVLFFDFFPGSEQDRPVDSVLQFAHVAAPGIVEKGLHCLRRKFQLGPIVLLTVSAQKMLDE